MGTPCGARTGIARAPHWNLECFSYPTGPVRGLCGTRKGAIRQPYGHVRELTQPELAKLAHGRRIWPYGARTGPLWGTQGLFTGCLQSLNPKHWNLECFSYPTGPVRGLCGTRKGAIRQPYGHVRELTQPELAKLAHGRRIWPYGARTGPLWGTQGLFTGCLQSLNPYGVRKFIMHY